MKVLFVTNGLPTETNPELCIFNKEQIESIEQRGLEVGIFFINAREKGRLEYLRSFRRLRRIASDYDVVHCFHGLSFLSAYFSFIKRPLVISFLSSLEYEYRELPWLLAMCLLYLTRILLYFDRDRVGIIFKGGIPRRFSQYRFVRHIPNGVDTETFHPADPEEAAKFIGVDPAKRYLLFVCSKTLTRKVKRYDRFLEVLKRLKSDGRYADIEALTLVNEERYRVPSFYSASSVHVLTSDMEGSPNSVKESLACGIPVVASDVGNVREMLSGLSNCFVVNPGDLDSYVGRIKEILDATGVTSNKYADEYRTALFSRGLSMDAVAKKIIDLYSKLIGISHGRKEGNT